MLSNFLFSYFSYEIKYHVSYTTPPIHHLTKQAHPPTPTAPTTPPPTNFRPQNSSTPTTLSGPGWDFIKPQPPKPAQNRVTSLVINFDSLGNKKHAFAANMASDNIDIVYATETHLSGESDAELGLDDFNIYRRDRPVNGHLGGGIMIAIRKSLDSRASLRALSQKQSSSKLFEKTDPRSLLHAPTVHQITILTFRKQFQGILQKSEQNSKNQNS